MASAFSFGFSGDDIDVDQDVEIDEPHNEGVDSRSILQQQAPSSRPVFPARKHPIEKWTNTLPSQISYSTLHLDIPSLAERQRKVLIGRRELFDVRTQLMAEDEVEADDDEHYFENDGSKSAKHEQLISDLEQGDLKPNFYEGGFKTWECALDLAELLSLSAGGHQDEEQNNEYRILLQRSGSNHIVELGCGTAVPSLAVFAQLLSGSTTITPTLEQNFRFTLADYNSTVLRLVTLTNFLLTWWLNSSASPRAKLSEKLDDNATADNEEGREEEKRNQEEGEIKEEEEEGELDIDEGLLEAFTNDLLNRGITLEFISGGWSPEFVRLVSGNSVDPNIPAEPSLASSTLILASETIYSPSTLGVFSETLLELLRKSGSVNAMDQKVPSGSHADQIRKATALIAAKKVYFGVGGGVDEFLQVLHEQPLQKGEKAVDVQERKLINSAGVKRVILGVQLKH